MGSAASAEAPAGPAPAPAPAPAELDLLAAIGHLGAPPRASPPVRVAGGLDVSITANGIIAQRADGAAGAVASRSMVLLDASRRATALLAAREPAAPLLTAHADGALRQWSWREPSLVMEAAHAFALEPGELCTELLQTADARWIVGVGGAARRCVWVWRAADLAAPLFEFAADTGLGAVTLRASGAASELRASGAASELRVELEDGELVVGLADRLRVRHAAHTR